ncbi:MAG: SRPBCC domain-containing protein [Flavobacteriales bacterium]|nr:SRPBCC domain-containing protein [Flavobacteriales bacterium]
MKTIKTAITINASAETIWKILANTTDYPKWNPLVVTLNGELKEGNNIEIHVSLGKDKPSVFKPKLLVVKKDAELRWLGSLFVKGLFDGEHSFQLEPQADGSVRFVHGEVFTGVLSSLIFGMIGKDTLAGFNAMNEALKQRAEAMNG